MTNPNNLQKGCLHYLVWEKGKSTLIIDNNLFDIEPSPFSEPFNGNGNLRFVKTAEELEGINCNNDILVLSEKITESPLQPKNYPFYYPDEHKHLISLLEEKQPKAIIAATGKKTVKRSKSLSAF